MSRANVSSARISRATAFSAKAVIRLALRLVDGGVGGAVDDRPPIAGPDHRLDQAGPGEIQVRRRPGVDSSTPKRGPRRRSAVPTWPVPPVTRTGFIPPPSGPAARPHSFGR